MVDDNTFKISVQVSDGTNKEFVFRTLREGNLGTWISYIQLNLSNPMIEIFAEPSSPPEMVPDVAPPNFWKVCRITNRELVNVA